jgi:hypothetical protein
VHGPSDAPEVGPKLILRQFLASGVTRGATVKASTYPFIRPHAEIDDGSESAASTTFYVDVDAISAVLGKATKLGGRTVMPPAHISGGLTIAALADPEGHVVGLSMSAVRR